MSNFDELVKLGRTFKAQGSSGALIQLEGNVAYLTNHKHSMLFRINLNETIGTGTFYSTEAPLGSERVERREDKVYFSSNTQLGLRSKFSPDRRAIKDYCEDALTKYYVEPTQEVKVDILSLISPDILVTDFIHEGTELKIDQRRTDGTVGFSNTIPLNAGFGAFSEEKEEKGKESLSFFSTDILSLKDYAKNLRIRILTDKPMSILSDTTLGRLVGLIAPLRREV